jgi:hypothetical protein
LICFFPLFRINTVEPEPEPEAEGSAPKRPSQPTPGDHNQPYPDLEADKRSYTPGDSDKNPTTKPGVSADDSASVGQSTGGNGSAASGLSTVTSLVLSVSMAVVYFVRL